LEIGFNPEFLRDDRSVAGDEVVLRLISPRDLACCSRSTTKTSGTRDADPLNV